MDLSSFTRGGPGDREYFEEFFSESYFLSHGWSNPQEFVNKLIEHTDGEHLPMFCTWLVLVPALRKCRSPIEERLLVHLAEDIDFGSRCRMAAGVRIGKYTADIVIWTPEDAIMHAEEPVMPFFLVIECDGKASHTSEAQVAHDKKRDRALTLMGWRVIRFTGSEIWSDPVGCADQVIEILRAHGLMW